MLLFGAALLASPSRPLALCLALLWSAPAGDVGKQGFFSGHFLSQDRSLKVVHDPASEAGTAVHDCGMEEGGGRKSDGGRMGVTEGGAESAQRARGGGGGIGVLCLCGWYGSFQLCFFVETDTDKGPGVTGLGPISVLVSPHVAGGY